MKRLCLRDHSRFLTLMISNGKKRCQLTGIKEQREDKGSVSLALNPTAGEWSCPQSSRSMHMT